MCINVWGLGALNVYWILTGLFFAISNALPINTDCNTAIPAWLGMEHKCNQLESFLNLVWCFAVVGWGLTWLRWCGRTAEAG